MIPTVKEDINTRNVDVLPSSLIPIVIKIGTHTAIVIASITSNTVHTGELNMALNIEASNSELSMSTLTVGKATKIIKIFIKFINKNGAKAHMSILYLYAACFCNSVPLL